MSSNNVCIPISIFPRSGSSTYRSPSVANLPTLHRAPTASVRTEHSPRPWPPALFPLPSPRRLLARPLHLPRRLPARPLPSPRRAATGLTLATIQKKTTELFVSSQSFAPSWARGCCRVLAMVWSAAATVSRFAALLATEIRLPLSVAAAAASVSFTGRRRFGPVAASLSTSVAGQADRGHQYAFQKDYYFFLPRNRTVFDINIEAFGEAVGDALMQMKRTQIMMLLFLFYASKCTNSLSCNLMYNCRLAELTTSRSMDLQSSLNFTSMDTLAALS